MFFRTLSLLVLCFIIQGCVTTDSLIDISNTRNTLSSGVSSFDETKYIRLANVACGDVELELYQDTNKAKSKKVLLTAGTRDIENIGRNESLLFKVDGKTYSFEAINEVTEHDKIDLNMSANLNYSNKDYIVPESFIRKFASANDVRAKLYLLNNTYVEGFCSPMSYEQYYEVTKPEDRKWLTQRSIDIFKKIAATKGFQKFVNMMDETF